MSGKKSIVCRRDVVGCQCIQKENMIIFQWPREKLQNLWSVTILVHVDDLQITAVYGSLKALQHVSVNVVCIEFRILQDIFDEIHNCCGCERMLIGIRFQNVLTSSDDICSISVQGRQKSALLKLQHQTSYTISYSISNRIAPMYCTISIYDILYR